MKKICQSHESCYIEEDENTSVGKLIRAALKGKEIKQRGSPIMEFDSPERFSPEADGYSANYQTLPESTNRDSIGSVPF